MFATDIVAVAVMQSVSEALRRKRATRHEQWQFGSDFWNDPRRWDGIADTHQEIFWMRRRPDIIDVRAL